MRVACGVAFSNTCDMAACTRLLFDVTDTEVFARLLSLLRRIRESLACVMHCAEFSDVTLVSWFVSSVSLVTLGVHTRRHE